MKRRGIVLLLLAALMLSLMLPALAADDPYTYEIRLFSGQRGTLDGGDLIVPFPNGVQMGDRVNVNIGALQEDGNCTVLIQQIRNDARVAEITSELVLSEGSKYYPVGIRESGKDNATITTGSFTVDQDLDLVVGYGLQGETVRYTVTYEDYDTGETLMQPQVYYGNVGDKVVIAYLYIDDYRPAYYNLTKTLVADETQNVIPFQYRKIAPEPTPTPTPSATPTPTPAPTATPAPYTPTQNTPAPVVVNPTPNTVVTTVTPAPTNTPAAATPTPTAGAQTPGTETPATDAPAQTGEPAAPGGEPAEDAQASPAPSETPVTDEFPDETEEIGDLDTPLAEPPEGSSVESAQEGSGQEGETVVAEPEDNGPSRGAIIGIIIGAIVLLALIIGLLWFFLFYRRRRNEDGEDRG